MIYDFTKNNSSIKIIEYRMKTMHLLYMKLQDIVAKFKNIRLILSLVEVYFLLLQINFSVSICANKYQYIFFN